MRVARRRMVRAFRALVVLSAMRSLKANANLAAAQKATTPDATQSLAAMRLADVQHCETSNICVWQATSVRDDLRHCLALNARVMA